MGGHAFVEHFVYGLEWQERPPGYLLSSVGDTPRKIRRHELVRAAKKLGVAVTFQSEIEKSETPIDLPIALFATRKTENLTAEALQQQAIRLCGSFFPGVVNIVPLETQA